MFAVGRMLRSLATLTLIALILSAASVTTARVASATNPCENEPSGPPGPINDPDPLVGGVVADTGAQQRISGATVDLYQCDGQGGSALFATASTNANGVYAFGGLDEAYYYVQARLTGPLAGMVPVNGTQNPTALIGIGDANLNVDLDFH